MVKNIFDTTDTSDLPQELQIARSDDFGQEILEVFYQAKELGLNELNVNQVMVAFHRMFRDKYAKKPKNNIQIMNKLFTMAAGKKYPLEKVKGKQGTYRLVNN